MQRRKGFRSIFASFASLRLGVSKSEGNDGKCNGRSKKSGRFVWGGEEIDRGAAAMLKWPQIREVIIKELEVIIKELEVMVKELEVIIKELEVIVKKLEVIVEKLEVIIEKLEVIVKEQRVTIFPIIFIKMESTIMMQIKV